MIDALTRRRVLTAVFNSAAFAVDSGLARFPAEAQSTDIHGAVSGKFNLSDGSFNSGLKECRRLSEYS